MISHRPYTGLMLRLSIGLAAVWWAAAGAATSDVSAANDEQSFDVGCVPDRPVAHPGDSIGLTAWVTDHRSRRPVKDGIEYHWTSPDGSVTGNVITANETASWKFAQGDIPAVKKVKANLTILRASQVVGRCEVSVMLAQPIQTPLADHESKRSLSNARRSFLLPDKESTEGKKPEEKYASYSYLLFDNPPKDEKEKQRYLKAIESFLSILQAMDELDHHRRASQISIILLPLQKDVPIPVVLTDPEVIGKTARLLLDAYDYEKAQDLLGKLGQESLRSGPYLVATTREAGAEREPPCLVFDMTPVVPRLVWDWVKTFAMLTTQERSWNNDTLEKLGLEMRNFLAVMTEVAPDVIDSAVKLRKLGGKG